MIIIPCTLVLLILAQPIVAILLNHVNATHKISARHRARSARRGTAGLHGLPARACAGLQAMQRAREVFYLYALENILTIALCSRRSDVTRSRASPRASRSPTAPPPLVALFALARHQVSIAAVVWSLHVRRSLGASLVATVVMAVAYALPSWSRGSGLIARFSFAVILGVASYGAVVLVQQRRIARSTSKDVRLKQF